MYLSGIDEQEIMSHTGHRSDKAIRKYKRSFDETQEKTSSVLDPRKKVKPESQPFSSTGTTVVTKVCANVAKPKCFEPQQSRNTLLKIKEKFFKILRFINEKIIIINQFILE